jgi:invasion protein IalB
MRIVIPIASVVVGAVAGWFGHSLVAAPASVPSISMYQDWRLACPSPSDAKGSCAMVQDVVDERSRAEIAHLALGKTKTGLEMVITMPYDVLLAPGMGIAIGSDPVRVYPYQTCNSVGCIATLPVDDKMLASLRNAKQARVLFAMLNNKPVGLPFSLNGFNEANDAFSNNEARRTSWWWRLWS